MIVEPQREEKFTPTHRLYPMNFYKELMGKTGSKKATQPERIFFDGAGMEDGIGRHCRKDIKSHLAQTCLSNALNIWRIGSKPFHTQDMDKDPPW